LKKTKASEKVYPGSSDVVLVKEKKRVLDEEASEKAGKDVYVEVEGDLAYTPGVEEKKGISKRIEKLSRRQAEKIPEGGINEPKFTSHPIVRDMTKKDRPIIKMKEQKTVEGGIPEPKFKFT